MIKIVMLTHFYYPSIGGNEGQCKILSEQLASCGNSITVLTKKYKKGLSVSENINGIIVKRVFCLSSFLVIPFNELIYKYSPKILFIHKVFNRLAFWLDEFIFIFLAFWHLILIKKKYDLIHVHQTHWIAFVGVLVSKLTNKPCLIKIATLNGFEELKMIPLGQLFKRVIIRNGFFIAVSSDIENKLIYQYKIKSEKIFKVSNGVIVPSECKKYLADENEILFVGNFSQGKIKGLDILINSLSRVKKEIPNFKLKIVGNGNPKEYENIIKDNSVSDFVEFLGLRTVSDFFKSSSIYVLPSRSEGMSNSLLEAMSYGMPCISSKVSGSTDLIKNMENGILFEIGDSNELARDLIFLLQNKKIAQRLGEKAFDSIRSNCQIYVIAKEYLNIYESII
jgi:glycosyltransferase involved in cell wall biosynthesis